MVCMRLLLVEIQVTFAGAKVDNNTVMYFEEISEQADIVCYTINFRINVSCEIGNSNCMFMIGNWYFSNIENTYIPAKQASSISTLFTDERDGATGTAQLQRFGYSSQTGHYVCAAPDIDKLYIHISETS